jgi:hypothetical protein
MKKSTRICTWFVASLIMFGWAAWTVADEPPVKSKPTPSGSTVKGSAAKGKATSDLDDELLKDLGDDGPAKPAVKPAAPKPPAPLVKEQPKDAKSEPKRKPIKPADKALDDELLKDLADDEPTKPRAREKQQGGGAADEGDEDDPLDQITRQMREVERRIREGDADQATQDLEHKIVEELEKLIKQARQQAMSQSSSPSKKPGQKSTRDQAAQPTPSGKQGSGSGAQANQAARDSSNRVGKPPAEVKKPDMDKILGILKDVWGELPPRLRQQMMQSSVEKFVPKYEFEIEEYFKTLAERREDQP